MRVNPQVVLGAFDQIRHSYGGRLIHSHHFHRPVALETQERAQSHSRGCGPVATVTAVLVNKGHSVMMLCMESVWVVAGLLRWIETDNNAGLDQASIMTPAPPNRMDALSYFQPLWLMDEVQLFETQFGRHFLLHFSSFMALKLHFLSWA